MEPSETNSSSVDQWYTILSDSERRLVVASLAAIDGPVSLAELTPAVASRIENGHVRHDPLKIRLHHWHLPLLHDARMVTYDSANRMVSTSAHPVFSKVDQLSGFDGT